MEEFKENAGTEAKKAIEHKTVGPKEAKQKGRIPRGKKREKQGERTIQRQTWSAGARA